MDDPIRAEATELRTLIERQQQEIFDLKRRTTAVAVDAKPTSNHTTRREVLTGAVAAVAGGATLALSTAAEAANNDPIFLGSAGNGATLPTGVSFVGDIGDNTYGFGVTDHGLGAFPFAGAIAGHTRGGFRCGVLGYDNNPSSFSSGVTGTSIKGNGVVGLTEGGAGVSGVRGFGQRGVVGMTAGSTPNNIGVLATRDSSFPGATALAVDGVFRARRAGRIVVSAGTRSKVIPFSPLTATSLVLATAQNKLAGTIAVQTVIIKTAAPTSFTIWLTANAPPGGMAVAWLVVDTIGTALS